MIRKPRALACLVLLLAACSKDEPPSFEKKAPAAPPPLIGDSPKAQTPKDEARRIWETACINCHGAEGRADGSLAANLNPKPRDLSDPAWQDGATDDAIAKVIAGGGAAVGKSSVMPARPDVAERPEVMAELVALIRALRRS